MKPWIRRLAFLGGALAIIGATLGFLVAKVFFQPDRLVKKIEKRLNCRASIGEVTVSLFSQPAQLVIDDFALGKRDELADQGVPFTQRAPLEDPEVTAERISLAVSFLHLLVGRLHVQELVGSDVVARSVKPEEGDSSLEILFDKPDREEDDDSASDGGVASKDDDEDEDGEDEEGESIDQLAVPATLHSARLENLALVIDLEEKQTRISWKDVQIALSDVSVSPHDLENHNRAQLDIEARVAFDDLEEGRHYGEFVIVGSGSVKPVDVQTREIEPEIEFQLEALPESYLEKAPIIDAVVDKLGDLEKYGVDIEDLNIGGSLSATAMLKGHYKKELFVLTDDALLDFENYAIELEEDSWYESDDNFHEFHAKLIAGPAVTERVLGTIDEFLSETLPFLPSDTFQQLIGDNFLQDGQFALGLVTKGEIGRPKVSFSEKLPDIDIKSVKDSAESLLDDLKSIFR